MDIEASVRMESLGEYFSFIIPDVETDIEQFPTYMHEYEGRNIQFVTNVSEFDSYYGNSNLNISILPVLGRFAYRLKTEITGYERDDFFE